MLYFHHGEHRNMLSLHLYIKTYHKGSQPCLLFSSAILVELQPPSYNQSLFGFVPIVPLSYQVKSSIDVVCVALVESVFFLRLVCKNKHPAVMLIQLTVSYSFPGKYMDHFGCHFWLSLPKWFSPSSLIFLLVSTQLPSSLVSHLFESALTPNPIVPLLKPSNVSPACVYCFKICLSVC